LPRGYPVASQESVGDDLGRGRAANVVNLGEGLGRLAAEAISAGLWAVRRMTGQVGEEQRRNIAVSGRKRRADLTRLPRPTTAITQLSAASGSTEPFWRIRPQHNPRLERPGTRQSSPGTNTQRENLRRGTDGRPPRNGQAFPARRNRW
jgi:hypothetical protein